MYDVMLILIRKAGKIKKHMLDQGWGTCGQR